MKVNVVIPMAGMGSRFSKEGYDKPKPFIDVLGLTMIERVMQNLSLKDAKYILIARKEHLEKETQTVKKIEDKHNVVFIGIDYVTEGAVCTVLHARKYINNDTPLLLANCDQIVDADIYKYVKTCIDKSADGSILTFKEPKKDPKWSYAKADTEGWVSAVKEKEAISDLATVGLYFFSKGRFFVDYALDMIVTNDRVNNEFYTCPVYNYAIRDGKKITHFEIDFDSMHGIGTPNDLTNFLKKNPLNY